MHPFARPLSCAIWMIRPDILELSLTHALRHPRPDQAADDSAGPTYGGMHLNPQVEKVGNVARVPIQGTILKNAREAAHLFKDVADLTVIDQQLQNVAADPDITDVLLDIRSPGGATQGVEETAQRIRQLSQSGKTVTAFSDQMMCSAAYYLGSAADQVLTTPSADVGSISTIATLVDASEHLEKEGIRLHIEKTGDHKDFGMFGKEVTEQDRAQLREMVQEADDQFKSFVRARRPQAEPAVTMTGKWFSGQRAQNYGLVDDLAPDLSTVALGLMAR